jgi:molybdopterin molybdotransferase
MPPPSSPAASQRPTEPIASSSAPTVIDADWFEARRIAHRVGSAVRVRTERLPLDRALGRTLAEDVVALSSLPGFASSAMDGWAVAGAGPWLLGAPIHAGDVVAAAPLEAGTARGIATGAMVPVGARAVLRSEHGVVDDGMLGLAPGVDRGEPRDGAHLRLPGEEAPAGAVLVEAGGRVTPPRIALAAVAGVDEVVVRARPRVELVVLGAEILVGGVAEAGRVRDAFGPQLPALLEALGLRSAGVRRVRDDLDLSVAALRAHPDETDLVIVTGGSSRGPTDHARAAIVASGGRIVIDGVAMRPGHPVMLGTLADGRTVLCLPGNPAAGLLALLSVGLPFVDGLLGRPLADLGSEIAGRDIPGGRRGVSLVAAAIEGGSALPCARQSAAMLSGLAAADTVLVVDPAGAGRGDRVTAIPLPW